MSPRGAAAIALVGWYLLTPPVLQSAPGQPSKVLPLSTPIAKWTVTEVFDTADSCNSARHKHYQEGSDNLDKMKTDAGHSFLQNKPDEAAEFIALGNAFMNAVCVATDDPRLKEK